MAFEHLAVGLYRLVKVFSQPVPFRLIGVHEQITDQRLNRRQMIVTGATPGHIIQETVNFFGDTPAFRVLQPTRADDIIYIVNAFRDRTVAVRHV
jgi:hypothetical protein